MKHIQQCRYCKKEFVRSVPRWYCSRTCSNKATAGPAWNKGIKMVLSDEARAAMAENARRNIAKETIEQRRARMEKVIAARKENKSWTPSMTGKIGDDSPHWLGESAGYNAKHRWIQNHWKKTRRCEECGGHPTPHGRRKWGTEWHNPNEQYRRERSEWMELCPSCHKKAHNK